MIASVVLLASCDSNDYWEAYTPQKNALYSFEQSTAKYTYTPSNLEASIAVTLRRAHAGEEVKVPLTAKTTSKVIALSEESVTFAKGSQTATINLDVDKEQFPIGVPQTLKLFIPQDYGTPSGNDSITVTVEVTYTWTAAGSCLFMSEWAETTEPVRVVIEKANEAKGLYRFVDLYNTLTPKAVPAKGSHILFTLDENNDAKALAPTYQLTGEKQDGKDIGIYCNPAHPSLGKYCSFSNEGNEFTLKCLFTSDGTPKWAVTESFVWDKGYPGAN